MLAQMWSSLTINYVVFRVFLNINFFRGCFASVLIRDVIGDNKVEHAVVDATKNLYKTESNWSSCNSNPDWSLMQLPPHLQRKLKDIPGVTREKRKPGPPPKSYRLKLYLLPPGSDIPQLTKNDSMIQTHQEQGCGYPAALYSEGKVKSSWDLYLSGSEFKETIRGLYPVLQDKDFFLFTIDQQRIPKPAPFDVQYFKQIKYSGTVFITTNN